jgi:hypothetical protein
MHLIVRIGVAVTTCLMLSAGASLSFGTSLPVAGGGAHVFRPGSVRLFRATADESRLRLISPNTLADMRRPGFVTGLRPSANQNPAILASADGSRFLDEDTAPYGSGPLLARYMTLRLFDARTGGLLATYHPPKSVWVSGISADGSRVYGFRGDVEQDAAWACRSWPFYVLNAESGAVVSQVSVSARPWDSILVGPSSQRLYAMTMPDHISGCGTQTSYHPQIIAYDLQARRKAGSVRLKGVLAGSWNTRRTMNGITVSERWQPGIALSPDGSHLAVVDGHDDTLTVLQARTLHVDGSKPLTRPQTALETIAGILGLAPSAAEAKGEIDGAELQAQYTPDGRSLIVTGTCLHPDRRHFYSSSESLGIRLVDVATGRVRAWLHDGKTVTGVFAAPDDSAIYSEAQGWTRQDGWQVTLRRHDPATLAVLAHRTFLHATWLNLLFLRAPAS